ncbi:MAG: hypothetical protein ACREJT_10120, partial [Myxococcota bacterium]
MFIGALGAACATGNSLGHMNLRKTFKSIGTAAAGSRVAVNLMILGVSVGLIGCAAAPPRAGAATELQNQAIAEPQRATDHSEARARQQLVSSPLADTSSSAQGTTGAQASEQGGPDGSITPTSQNTAPPPTTVVESPSIDPGAAAVARALREALNEHNAGVSVPVTIVFGRFRNQSRASAEEFAAMAGALRAALTAAAAGQGILCV